MTLKVRYSSGAVPLIFKPGSVSWTWGSSVSLDRMVNEPRDPTSSATPMLALQVSALGKAFYMDVRELPQVSNLHGKPFTD